MAVWLGDEVTRKAFRESFTGKMVQKTSHSCSRKMIGRNKKHQTIVSSTSLSQWVTQMKLDCNWHKGSSWKLKHVIFSGLHARHRFIDFALLIDSHLLKDSSYYSQIIVMAPSETHNSLLPPLISDTRPSIRSPTSYSATIPYRTDFTPCQPQSQLLNLHSLELTNHKKCRKSIYQWYGSNTSCPPISAPLIMVFISNRLNTRKEIPCASPNMIGDFNKFARNEDRNEAASETV